MFGLAKKLPAETGREGEWEQCDRHLSNPSLPAASPIGHKPNWTRMHLCTYGMASAIGPTKRPATTPFAMYVYTTAGFATEDEW